MTTKPIQTIATLALAAVLLTLAGCANKASPDNVDRRAVERWNYLAAHDGAKAYDYLTPGFRATQTRENYAASMNNRPVRWKGATFKSKECDAERCNVKMDVSYSLTLPGVSKETHATSPQSETWILTKGEWYFLPK